MRVITAAMALSLLNACSTDDHGRKIVASIYPLAFVAETVAGPGWEVIDLTPPGVEAHDLELTLEQRSEMEEATLVFHLPPVGFQPQLERILTSGEGDFSGLVVHVGNPRRDPHVWLSPHLMAAFPGALANALSSEDEEGAGGFALRSRMLLSDFEALDAHYREGLGDCRFGTAIVTHEAFGYVADEYGFEQFGLSGTTPEAEPSATRLSEARDIIEQGGAGAIFYEARGEDTKASKALADDLGVASLPLDTLESRPPAGDYISVMKDNLESLREGLQCR